MHRTVSLPSALVLLMALCGPLLHSQITISSDAFVVRPSISHHQNHVNHRALFLGKGLNKAKNKQALLKQKLEEAKRQKIQGDNDDAVGEKAKQHPLTDEEIKERNDRKRFEELLKKGAANVLNDYSSDGYLNKQQEEEEIDAFRKFVCGIAR